MCEAWGFARILIGPKTLMNTAVFIMIERRRVAFATPRGVSLWAREGAMD
jgi:hypothetical protein